MTLPAALATLFGLGRVRVAPGTLASLAALVTAWPIALGGGRIALLGAGLAAGAVGTWVSELYAGETAQTDPGDCVIDELTGQWIACAFAPVSILAYLLAFILFRILDIAKPWPISRLEHLSGGVGIMADDVLAGLLAGGIVAVLAHARLV